MDAMTITRSVLLLLLVASVLHGHPGEAKATAVTGGGDSHETEVYIVFTARQTPPASAVALEMSESADVSAKIKTFHHALLSDALGGSSSSARDRVVYHYTRSLHGFAARLTEGEKNNLAGKEGVLSIHERVVYRPQTTRSWDFLGLPLHEHPSLPFEQDVIIGVIDTGITPGSESFSDDGLAPPPAKWKGRCSKRIKCNNKIIGAWAYDGGYPDGPASPIDDDGHGTHVASTAAGRAVGNASLYGVANGTARGAVPGARLAIYKVCWYYGCAAEDILAAFDDAIADGVDVITAPISLETVSEYADDVLAIGAFHAVRRGVLTSVPAGNCGPKLGTVSNVAPWMITAAGTTTDRRIVSRMVLGNGKRILAHSMNTFPDIGKQSLLVAPGSCNETLEGAMYKGAILLCPPQQEIVPYVVIRSGAAGIILVDTSEDKDKSFTFPLPVVLVWPAQFQDILRYYNESRYPVARILNSETVYNAVAPSVAGFSSRGPNLITPGVIKPDISAPGVEILAAWSPLSAPSTSYEDVRVVPYNIISGTSMACPHVTGAAAYVKSVHPQWSPAAIISSLVTTATPLQSNVHEAEFAYGAGQANPTRAVDPGLVYNASEADYVNLLCAQGYNTTQLATMTGTNTTCLSPTGSMADLNYPSIAVPVINYGVDFAVEIPRKVTNVGPVNSVYRAKISREQGITVSVEPDELAFTAERRELNFMVSVMGSLQAPAADGGSLGASASIIWSDGKHQVRSPIYVFPKQFRSYVEPAECRCRPGKCDSQLDY